ncbi:hypothetical protein WT11_09295 [Burkholderia stagnalis]|nr:hypothetical protein WT11_09295 [Burkholderia stagnalis]
MLAARLRVGGPFEQREQRRQQRNQEVVRIVHAVGNGKGTFARMPREPEYAHLSARATRCGACRRMREPRRRPELDTRSPPFRPHPAPIR